MKAADVCCKHGMGSATLDAWTAKYGSTDVSQAQKLTVVEEENGRLKRLLAGAARQGRCFGVSERRARAILAGNGTLLRHALRRNDDGDLRSELRESAVER